MLHTLIEAFLWGLFGSMFLGTMFSYGLATRFFLEFKQKHKRNLWSNFHIPTLMLATTILIGAILFTF